jgi:AcrR family transcriptional regulator
MQVPSKVESQDLVADRRGHLVKTATALFLQRGFHKTTVREIAEAAGWTPGTLYLYIARKEDILYLIIDSIVSDLSGGLLSQEPRATPRQSLEAAMNYLFTAVDRKRREVKLMYRESASLPPEYLTALKQTGIKDRAFLVNIVQRGIDEGEFRSVDAPLLADNIIAIAHMWALKGWVFVGRGMSCDEYLRVQKDLLFTQLGITSESCSDLPQA